MVTSIPDTCSPVGCARLPKVLLVLSLIAAAPAAHAFAQNGTVSGTVTNAATGAPLAGGTVQLCTSSACSSSATNASGAYMLSLAPGTYFAQTSGFNSQGFVNEIHANIPCPGNCDFTTLINSGTPVVVTSGGAATVNFALDIGGTVSGVVTDAATGLPVQNVNVSLRTFIGTRNVFASGAATNISGVYSITGLAPGTYYAFTASGSTGYTNEVYDNVLCAGVCSATLAGNSGHPIGVTAGATTGAINFALAPGGRISGTVVNAQTSTAIANVTVSAYARIGLSVTFIGSASTNASGVYTIGGLPTGTYFLQTSTAVAVNEIYNNVPCLGSCSTNDTVVLGEPVPVTVGNTTAGRDFQLEPGGVVAGTVLETGTLTPIANATVFLYRQTGPTSGFSVRSAGTNATGAYSIMGVPPGTYFAIGFPPSTHAGRIFGGGYCAPSCSLQNVFAGTPIAVTAGVTTSGRDFSLDPAGTITGTVTDSATAAPVSGGFVGVYSGGATPLMLTSVSINAAGNYSIGGLAPGTYFVATSVNQYANEAFDNVACPTSSGFFCSTNFVVANGTPIAVSGGMTTSGINLALAPQPTSPGSPSGLNATVSGGTVQFTWFAPTSGGVATSYILEAGLSPGTTAVTLPAATTSLTVPGVPAGTFYIRVRAVNAFGTGPASAEFTLRVGGGGTGIPDAPTALVAWTSGGRLTMTWSNPTTGSLPSSFVVEAGTASGLSNIAAFNVTTRSFVFEGVPNGFYFLRVRSRTAGGVSVPSAEVMINVGNVPAPPSPPQSFTHSRTGSTVTFSWVAPILGTPTSYVLEAGTATGLANITTFDTGSAGTTFVVASVPPGTYYVRLRSRNALGNSPVSNERVVTVPVP
jgi:hypothetical protein